MALATVLASALADGQAPSGDLSCPDPAEIESQLIRMGGTGNARPEIVITGDRCNEARADLRHVMASTKADALGKRAARALAACP